MTIEYEIEPIKGLPGHLPKGEFIVWQGAPDWWAFARAVFHTRLVLGWFVLVASLAFLGGGTGLSGALTTLVVGALGLGVLAVLAWTGARSTVYTLTNRRVVMRFGASVPKCVNLPLSKIGAADVKPISDQFVDIVLAPTERFPLGWLQAWPHVRPWKVASPQPMLRAVDKAFLPILADALQSSDPARATAANAETRQRDGLEAAA